MRKKRKKKSMIGWAPEKWLKEFRYRNITTQDIKDNWLIRAGGNYIKGPRIYRKKNDSTDGREYIMGRIPVVKVCITIKEIK